jgi:hypothetical protein
VFLTAHPEARNIEAGASHGPFCIHPPALNGHECNSLVCNHPDRGSIQFLIDTKWGSVMCPMMVQAGSRPDPALPGQRQIQAWGANNLSN